MAKTQTALARGSDGRDYTLLFRPGDAPGAGPDGPRREIRTSDGRPVAEDARGRLRISGAAVTLELIYEHPHAQKPPLVTPAELKALRMGDRVATGWEAVPVEGLVDIVGEEDVFLRWDDGLESSLWFGISAGDGFLRSLTRVGGAP